MGKLGKKARKFAKKNLPSVLRQRRKNKITFKKRPSKKDKKDVAEKVINTAELSKGRDSDIKVVLITSLDALFDEDDNVMVLDDSDSDGYLSEDSSCENLPRNDNDVTIEDDRDKHTLSIQNQKIYEELVKQKKSLNRLKKKDQKFVTFLESYNKGKTSENQEMHSDEDEIGEDLMLEKSATTKQNLLTCSAINSWSKLVKEENSESALIRLINAYRAVCHLGSEETGITNDASCPIIQDSATFCEIYIFMLSEADNIFRSLLKISSSNCKKEAVLELKNTSRWKKVKPMIMSYLRSSLFLLKQATDSEILAFCLTRLRASIVFFAAFPSLLSRFIQIIIPLWATGGGNLSASSSLAIHDVVSVLGSDLFDTCFIKTYKAYIALCRSMETIDAKHIEFLMDSFADLCSIDVELSCNKALLSIQQLANILQHVRQNENKEAIKTMYSWQYVKCVDLWVLFISANVHEGDVQPLLYMMIQLINGIAHLFSGPRYVPLRTRCIEWLNKLSSSSGIFIPVASLVLDMLEYKVSKQAGKSRKAVKLASRLKFPKFWLKSQNFAEQCVYSAVELLVKHFMQWSYHISFPEVATIPLIRLRKFQERTTIESLRRVVKRLVDQVEQNVEFIQKKRDDVAFSPKDQESVDLFLQFEKGTANTPFTQYYRSVIEKAAIKMSTSPQEPKRVKRKKTQVVENTSSNGDSEQNHGNGVVSNGKKRKVTVKEPL